MCPDLVVAAQKIAAMNPHVTAHVYDIRHFENMKNHYKVMSVPCMVVNNKDLFFGKKNIHQILELIRKK
jgi:thioredoxin reductase (NADPH)